MTLFKFPVDPVELFRFIGIPLLLSQSKDDISKVAQSAWYISNGVHIYTQTSVSAVMHTSFMYHLVRFVLVMVLKWAMNWMKWRTYHIHYVGTMVITTVLRMTVFQALFENEFMTNPLDFNLVLQGTLFDVFMYALFTLFVKDSLIDDIKSFCSNYTFRNFLLFMEHTRAHFWLFVSYVFYFFFFMKEKENEFNTFIRLRNDIKETVCKAEACNSAKQSMESEFQKVNDAARDDFTILLGLYTVIASLAVLLGLRFTRHASPALRYDLKEYEEQDPSTNVVTLNHDRIQKGHMYFVDYVHRIHVCTSLMITMGGTTLIWWNLVLNWEMYTLCVMLVCNYGFHNSVRYMDRDDHYKVYLHDSATKYMTKRGAGLHGMYLIVVIYVFPRIFKFILPMYMTPVNVFIVYILAQKGVGRAEEAQNAHHPERRLDALRHEPRRPRGDGEPDRRAAGAGQGAHLRRVRGAHGPERLCAHRQDRQPHDRDVGPAGDQGLQPRARAEHQRVLVRQPEARGAREGAELRRARDADRGGRDTGETEEALGVHVNLY
eukprot:464104-Hanusia_phi.AAC.3